MVEGAKREWTKNNIRLIEGDCTKILPHLDHIDAVVTDPPYGVKHTRAYPSGSRKKGWKPIVGDDEPFDPGPWIKFPKVVLFGYQFFAERLPLGTVIVWNKRTVEQAGCFMSDAELAWQKGGYGCYLFHHVWKGGQRDSERGEFHHPTMKPRALFRWILEKRLKLTPGQVVLDPYAGSASVGLACVELGLGYIGIEIDPDYFDVGVKRISSTFVGLGKLSGDKATPHDNA